MKISGAMKNSPCQITIGRRMAYLNTGQCAKRPPDVWTFASDDADRSALGISIPQMANAKVNDVRTEPKTPSCAIGEKAD